ncbi:MULTISPECIES: DUF6538 domain-containing protein [Acidiphilium]|uniref:DUF6538 domain-containing protein n=1 Tax=Acidiphilium TaxID=522 RepID=UPI0038B38811
MTLCSFVERRRQRYYFRVRLPREIVPILGRTHVVASLGTGESAAARVCRHLTGGIPARPFS